MPRDLEEGTGITSYQSIVSQLPEGGKEVNVELQNLHTRIDNLEKEVKELREKMLDQKLTTINDKLDKLLEK